MLFVPSILCGKTSHKVLYCQFVRRPMLLNVNVCGAHRFTKLMETCLPMLLGIIPGYGWWMEGGGGGGELLKLNLRIKAIILTSWIGYKTKGMSKI